MLTDEKGVSKYVLLVSINPGAPNGGSGTQYFIGDFRDGKFTSDTPGTNSGWIDYGPDNYAGVTWANIGGEDRRRIFIGWMSNWLYAQVVPTQMWRSAMTIPRALTLETLDRGHVLKSTPVAELSQLVSHTTAVPAKEGRDTVVLSMASDSLKIPYIVKGAVSDSDFVLEFSNSRGEKVSAGFDSAKREFFIDRDLTRAGFHPDFNSRAVAPRNSKDSQIRFLVIVDVSSLEVFFDDGRTTMTAIVFPDEVYGTVKLFGRPGNLDATDIEVQQLRSIW